MKSPAAVRAFFETVLQRVRHFKVDVIAGDAKAAAYRVFLWLGPFPTHD